MYQQGTNSIANGATSVVVTFPQAFASVPAVVVPVVRNISNDGTKLPITANTTSWTASGFTVTLSQATNSANYELVWIAGDSQAVLAVFSALSGRSLASYPSNASLHSSFLLPLLTTSPTSALKHLTPDAFWSAVVQRVSSQPGTPGDALPDHNALGLYLDETNGYLYLSGATQWMRVALDGSANWTGQPFFVPFREATVVLEPDGSNTEFEVTFATAFSAGENPSIAFSLGIPADVTTPAVMHAMQKGDSTLSGFTLIFNAPLQHNVTVYYYARQLP